MVKRYFWFLFIAVDQLANTVLGGYPDETLSSRMGKRPHCPICRILCWFLNFIDKDHCVKSIEYDEGTKFNKH